MAVNAMVFIHCEKSFCAGTGSYHVEFKGLEEENLLSQIKALSRTLEMSSKPAGSVKNLEKRAREDIELFIKFMKSEGYFNTEITETIEADKKTWRVVFKFTSHAPFILSSVNIRFVPGSPDDIKIPDMSKTGMNLNERYRSKAILEGEEKLLLYIRKQGFHHPVVEKRDIVADHKTGSVKIDYEIDPGKKAFFGDTEFTGLKDVDHTFLKKFIPWKRGDIYDPDSLNKCYNNLMDLGLFSTIKITEGEKLEGDSLPIDIEVTERKHNSVGVGLSYRTDEGAGAKLSWENRNLFGNGEKLGFRVNLSDLLKTAESFFKKPAFLISEQTLHFSVKGAREDTDAYDSESLSGSTYVDRELSEKLDVRLGLAFKWSEIIQLDSVNSYRLLSVPMHFNLDYSDDLLDPKRGGRLAVKLIPYYAPSGESLYYSKSLISYSHYFKILNEPGIVLAGSVSAGTINGAGRIEVPGDERFYAGGGGSVRGYSYQSIGPLSETTPLGGKALFETSVEARIRITGKWGMVLFFDGGTAYSNKLFDKGEIIRWGTGIGVRYFTPIGPLRFDVGVPLDRRDGLDDSFQVYISIGQAF